MPYELRTLGGLDLSGPDGASVEPMLAHSKGMALLAVLAVEGREEPVSRSEVAALLWPDRSEERAQNALRITLTRIRKDADPALVKGKREATLRLNPGLVAVDWWAFEDARSAGDDARLLDLYRGHFLEGFRLSDAAPFERWADRTRERARDRVYEAALTSGARAREDGDLEGATEGYRRALDLRPLREEAAEGLVRVLGERGRAAEAIRAFQRFRERRRDEMDLSVSDELEELVERIRAGELSEGSETVEPRGTAPAPDEVADRSELTRDQAPGRPGGPTVDAGSAKRRLAAPLAVLLVALAAWGAWQMYASGEAGGGPVEKRAIAVLPFTPIGVDEEPDVFAEGLHSDLVTRLSTASTLDVISNTSVQQFRDRNVSLPTIADTLGARWVLEGEVQRMGDRLGVNVQLIDPRTDRHVWAESFRRDLTAENYFELQDEISGHVVDVLDARLGEAVTRPRGPIEDLDAYRFYVRGRSLLEQRDPEQMRRSLEYFDQALAADSAYARAWAGRANALSILARYPAFGPDTLLPKAEEAVRRALELDADPGEAHAALGRLHMYRRKGPAALDAFRRAIELQPSFAEAHAWLAKLQLTLGMPEEALASVHRAVRLDPLSPENLGTLVFALLAGDRPDSALVVSRRIGDLAEGSGWIYEAHVHGYQGRLEEMRSAFRRSGSELRELPVYATRAAALGDPSLARTMLDELRPDQEPFEAALLRAGLGEPERALELLRALYPREDRPWDLFYSVYLRYLWPATLDPVRELPGYDSLIREMNVAWGLSPDGSLPGG